MSKPRIIKVPQLVGPAKWCVITDAYGFSFQASRMEKFDTWRDALAHVAQKTRTGGYTVLERIGTPEHGPDYYGQPARYWPGVYR